VTLLLILPGPGAAPAAGEEASAPRERAVQLLTDALGATESSDLEKASTLLKSAVEPLQALLEGPPALAADERKALERLRDELLVLSGAPLTDQATVRIREWLRLLGRPDAKVEGLLPGTLEFSGSYTRSQVLDQAEGGHVTAPGPTTTTVSSAEDAREVKDDLAGTLLFVPRPVITEKTFCGGPTKDHLLESGGSGVALLDYDDDGLLDIYMVTAFELGPGREPIPHQNQLYRNRGGWTFENVSESAGVGLSSWGNGVCAGDYDADGHLDLYVTNFGPNFLFRNGGDGSFREVAAEAGLDHPGWSTGCSFFDVDGDEDLDLYVANYVKITWDEVLRAQRTFVWRGGPQVMVGPFGMPPEADALFRNEGDGTFTDLTQSSGVSRLERAYGFGVLTSDLVGNGWPDVYVANDSNPNYLLYNDATGRLEEVGLIGGAAMNLNGRAQAGMGVASGDLDGDGLLDIVVNNFAQDTNIVYRSLGEGIFEDLTGYAGFAARTFERVGWGVDLFDADLDGDLDVFAANGHLYPQVDQHPDLKESFRQKNQLLLNREGRFRDVSDIAGTGLQVEESSRGVAVGDLDNDGDLDVVITNIDAPPTVLENRSQSPGHWVALKLRKPGSNPFCIGAMVRVKAGGSTQTREIRSGGGFLSQGDLRPHFGLGPYTGTVDVEVRLPGGARWAWTALPADRLHELRLDPEARLR
jgi:hypothetical protein